MTNFTKDLENMVKIASALGRLTVDTLHRIIFSSFLRAGLSVRGVRGRWEEEVKDLIRTIPAPYRAQVSGELYLNALSFIKAFNSFLEDSRQAVIIKEANLQHIVQLLESRVGKVDGVFVFDCASVPEFIAIASKFSALGRNTTILEEVFVNPVGVTRFLTGQLEALDRGMYLAHYARLLKERLRASFSTKISTIDLITHRQGFTLRDFLDSLKPSELFEEIRRSAEQKSVLITSDHGYDVIMDEHGFYVTHGYYKENCLLSFSRIALFLVID